MGQNDHDSVVSHPLVSSSMGVHLTSVPGCAVQRVRRDGQWGMGGMRVLDGECMSCYSIVAG